MTEHDLAAIEARHAAAHPGPWSKGRNNNGYWLIQANVRSRTIATVLDPRDATFLMHAHADIRALIAALREAWEERDEALKALDAVIKERDAETDSVATHKAALDEALDVLRTMYNFGTASYAGCQERYDAAEEQSMDLLRRHGK
jgi:hypothetical protein